MIESIMRFFRTVDKVTSLDSPEPPVCADCTHYLHEPPAYVIPERHSCMRRVYDERHIVTGKMVTRGNVECYIERGVMGGCGTAGIHFKKKDQ